jgi:hypothetical protein
VWQEQYFNPCCDSLAAAPITGKTWGVLPTDGNLQGSGFLPQPDCESGIRNLTTLVRRLAADRIENPWAVEIPITILSKSKSVNDRIPVSRNCHLPTTLHA